MLDLPVRSHSQPELNNCARTDNNSNVGSISTTTVSSPCLNTSTSYCPIKDITTCSNNLTTTTLNHHNVLLPRAIPFDNNSNPITTSNTTNNASILEPNEMPNHSPNSSTRLKLKLENQFFTEKADIKPWLQDRLDSLGINIVIERSDDTKIVFKCKYSCSSPASEDENNSKITKPKLKSKSRKSKKKKKKFCPFRIRANYSIRLKHWSLVIVNDTHNHPLPFVNIEDVQEKLQYKNKQNNDETAENHLIPESQSPKSNDSKNAPSIAKVPLQTGGAPENLTTKVEMSRSSTTGSQLGSDTSSSSNIIPNKLPPLKITSPQSIIPTSNDVDYYIRQPRFFQQQTQKLSPTLDLNYKSQVKKIEDTLKGLEKIDSITEDSKGKIFNNVLSVLNNSIFEASVSNSSSNSSTNSHRSSFSPPATSTTSTVTFLNPIKLPNPIFNSQSSKFLSSSTSSLSPSSSSSSSNLISAPSPTQPTFKYTPLSLPQQVTNSNSNNTKGIVLPSLDILKRGLDSNIKKSHTTHNTHNNHFAVCLGKDFI